MTSAMATCTATIRSAGKFPRHTWTRSRKAGCGSRTHTRRAACARPRATRCSQGGIIGARACRRASWATSKSRSSRPAESRSRAFSSCTATARAWWENGISAGIGTCHPNSGNSLAADAGRRRQLRRTSIARRGASILPSPSAAGRRRAGSMNTSALMSRTGRRFVSSGTTAPSAFRASSCRQRRWRKIRPACPARRSRGGSSKTSCLRSATVRARSSGSPRSSRNRSFSTSRSPRRIRPSRRRRNGAVRAG